MPDSLIKRNSHPVERQTEATKNIVCNFSALLKAEQRCHRGVGYKNSVARFHTYALSKCYDLYLSLQDETYHTQHGHEFEIFEPKRRTVSSLKYLDRIPQASFSVNYYYPQVVSQLQPDNYACVKGRGVDRARKDFENILRNAKMTDYCLVADIKSYFASIKHEHLYNMMKKFGADDWTLRYYMDVINCNGTQDGIGLGSEINQLSATSMLDSVDKMFDGNRYKRYMDDFRYVGTKQECMDVLAEIEKQLNHYGLKINTKKTYIQPVKRPIKFLGFTYLRHETGKVTKKRLRCKVNNEKRKIKRMLRKGVPTERILEHCQSVQAMMRKGTRSGLCKYMKYISTKVLRGDKYAIHPQARCSC